MTDNAPPSRNPANDDNLTGVLKEVLKKWLQDTDDMLPAAIVSYDRATNIAEVKPMIKLLTTESQTVTRANISSVPVLLLGGGDFFLSFNLPVGSLGWIKASDRDISLYLQSLTEEGPNTLRLHSFSDAIFIPQVMAGYTIDAEDNEAMTIQNLDGSVRISLNDSRIKMTSPLVEVDAENANFTGTINAAVDVIANGISLVQHPHPPGSLQDAEGRPLTGNTGAPNA